METIECSKCGAIFEKTGAKDKLRRFKDKRFMTTFHCPNCDARVFVKEDKTDVHLQRLQRLKRQAELLGDREEAKELDEEINQFYREKNEMNAGKTKDKGLQGEEKNIQWLVRPNYSSSGVDSFALIVVNKITNKKIKKDFPTQEEAFNNIDKYIDMVKDSKTTDSLFKGQKVTAIKSEQGLREGETYTVLGEETIVKQIVGENDATVYKLQDSSGNVIVIENPEGLFYEVKDSKTKDALMECMECGYKFKKNLSPNTFEVKCPKCGGYDVDVISGDSKIKDANYPEIYKGFYIHLQSNNKLEGYRKNRSFVKNTWQELKKKIDEFWRMKELSPEEKEYAEKNYLNRDSSDFYTKDPLTKKGQKILAAMKKAYGEEKGKQIFYASKNKGTISGVDSKSKNGPSINDPAIRNQIRVALQTLKMPSAMLGVMGGTTKEQAKEILRKYGVKFEDSKMKDWLDPEARVLSEKVLRKMKEIHKRTKQTNIYDLFDDAIRGLGITGKIKEDVRILILQGANHRYTEEFIFKDSKIKGTKDDYKTMKLADLLKKAKEGYFELQSDPKPRNHVEIRYPNGKKEWIFVEDQEIKITIGEDPVNPSPAEQKVESNDVIYKEYTLKQLPETGEFEIYAPDGSIVGHAKALELAKLFVDRIVASLVSDAKTKDVMSERRA